MRDILSIVILLAVSTLSEAQTPVPATFTAAWDYTDVEHTGFNVYHQCDVCTDPTVVDIPDPAAREITLTLQAGTYNIWVTAYNAAQESASSNVLNLLVDGGVLNAPSRLRIMSGATHTIYDTETPDFTGDDGIPWELGTQFMVSVPGSITELRHWAAEDDTFMHTGRLWQGDVLLAQAAFSQSSGIGWQSVVLDTPVEVVPGEIYTVSVDANTLWPNTAVGPVGDDVITYIVDVNGATLGMVPATVAGAGYHYFRDVVFTDEI